MEPKKKKEEDELIEKLLECISNYRSTVQLEIRLIQDEIRIGFKIFENMLAIIL